jgi:hypothetical protein
MNSFTVTAVGNLAKDPELAVKGDTTYTKFCLLGNDYAGKDEQGDARVAREYLVVLPYELKPDQRVTLARDFALELSDRYQFGVDLAVHAPRTFPGSDPRNFHAHLLATTREITASGLGSKTRLEWSDARRAEAGLGPAINELLHVRERWAVAANAALLAGNIEVRVDHRTLKAQGIDREPLPWIPRVPYELERRGYRSTVAERIRQEYQERMQSRQPQRVDSPVAEPPPNALEAIRREAREAWLKMRAAGAAAGPERAPQRGADDDFAP